MDTGQLSILEIDTNINAPTSMLLTGGRNDITCYSCGMILSLTDYLQELTGIW
jgi:hypothetical protein